MDLHTFESRLYNLFFRDADDSVDRFITEQGVRYRNVDESIRRKILWDSEIRLTAVLPEGRTQIRVGVFDGQPYMIVRLGAIFTAFNDDLTEALKHTGVLGDVFQMLQDFKAEFGGERIVKY